MDTFLLLILIIPDPFKLSVHEKDAHDFTPSTRDLDEIMVVMRPFIKYLKKETLPTPHYTFLNVNVKKKFEVSVLITLQNVCVSHIY